MGEGADCREQLLIHFCPFMQGSLGSMEKGKETLRSFVTDITAKTEGKALSLVIVDQEKHLRYGFVLKT